MDIYRNTYPSLLDTDDTLLFHGTNNLSEHAFDSPEFRFGSLISLDEVELIKSFYRELDWCGVSGGGFVVLNSFSSTGYENGRRGMYLGETIQRVRTYASQDFAGGELARSVNYALTDLFMFAESPTLRERVIEEYEASPQFGGRSFTVDLTEFVNRIIDLKPLLDRLKRVRSQFQYGVILCYRVPVSFYHRLRFDYGMGIWAGEGLPSEYLLAKIVVDDWTNLAGDDSERWKRGEIWKNRISGC